MTITGVTMLCTWGLTALSADASPPEVTTSNVASVQDDQSVTLSGIVVSGFEDATDPLLVSVSSTMGTLSMPASAGLTVSDGYTFSGSPAFSFTGDEDDVNNGLASLDLMGGGTEGDADITVDVSEEPDLGGGNSLAYDSGTGHYYEYVADGGVTWTSASTDAESLSYEGQSGYLAAVPNSAVNSFITEHLDGAANVWAGGMGTLTDGGYGGDANVERYWTWLYGPWAGQVFTECSNWAGPCDHIDDTGDYYGWSSGEPNNGGGRQDYDREAYVEINYSGNGNWNDCPSDGCGRNGYVVEFGDLTYGGDFTGDASSSSTITMTTTPAAPTAVTVVAGSDDAEVTWVAPGDDGDSPITSYVITPYIGVTAQPSVTATGTTTSAEVVELSPGVEYTFTVGAINVDGPGPQSSASLPVTVYAPPGDTSTTMTTLAPTTTATTLQTGTTTTTGTPATVPVPVTKLATTTTTSTPQPRTTTTTSTPATSTGGVAATPDGEGYWSLTPQGAVAVHGNAGTYQQARGGITGIHAMTIGATNDGQGYWLAGTNGSVAAFGDAHLYGSMTRTRLNGPVVQVAGAPDGNGYWLVASDGGVFNFGAARFYGSLAERHLSSPVVGMDTTPYGDGYLLADASGDVYAFGGAHLHGSMSGVRLNRPMVGIVEAPDGKGYWLLGGDGGVFAFGSARFYGSLGATGKARIVAMIANGDLGYRLISSDGTVYGFGVNP